MTYQYLKRLEDVILSVILLTFFFPVCVITAIAVKLEKPTGPLWADTPKRVGKNGTLFYAYKFRSMIPNAHILLRTDPTYQKKYIELKQNSYKLYDDPRVTKTGRIIRRYSIDEIPQFLNVLKGEMSVVGPRPYYADELADQQQKYPQTKELVKKALSVKPGITGEWQVSGRSQINFDKRIEMDALYAQNSSLWYDLKILLKTPFAMLSGRGAY